MGFSNSRDRRVGEDGEGEELLVNLTSSKVPKDSFHFAYFIYFTIGAGYLLPWNAFITAVDYFHYLYPDYSVDRVFALVCMLVNLLFLTLIITNFSVHNNSSKNSASYLRINMGFVLFTVSLMTIPLMDLVYIKGRAGLYVGYWVTIAAVALSGVADAMVQGSVIGSVGELPKRYTQAVVAGTGSSGVLVSVLRIITKSMFPQDTYGLRTSAIMYFAVAIVAMVICIIFHNIANTLPIVRYYKDQKMQMVNEDPDGQGQHEKSSWSRRSTLGDILSKVKWSGFGIFVIYIVTLSIFPGFITEDVHSEILKDWYPIILITCFNVFDLVGKSLTAIYLLEDLKVAITSCTLRVLFYPLFYVCLNGPKFFRTEIPVVILTSLLGLTNGYFTSVLMILAPRVVEIQHAETAGIAMVLFLVGGLAAGSVVAWFWVI